MINYNEDSLSDVELLIGKAQYLWDKQCFTQPNKEDEKEIKELLLKASEKLNEVIKAMK